MMPLMQFLDCNIISMHVIVHDIVYTLASACLGLGSGDWTS